MHLSSGKYPTHPPTLSLQPEARFCRAMNAHYAVDRLAHGSKLPGHKFKTVALFFVFSHLFFFSKSARAQYEMNYAVQANIIYHFTRYIDWPTIAKTGDFVIGVVGDTPLYDELKRTMKNKMAGDKKIIVEKYLSSKIKFDCHILFIGEEESHNIKRISAMTANDPVLLVSEQPGLARKGACINFVVVNQRLQLEINKNNITGRKLNIASELLQLGKLVK
jgi:hypothetical protein